MEEFLIYPHRFRVLLEMSYVILLKKFTHHHHRHHTVDPDLYTVLPEPMTQLVEVLQAVVPLAVEQPAVE
jgi:hypothetical protein